MKHITFIILAICILQNIFAQKPDFDEKEMQTQFAMLNNAKSINDLKNTFIGDYFRNYTPPPPEAGSQNYIISLLPTSEGGIQTTDFFDGFGRRLQTVSKQLSPLHKDIAVKYEYEGGKVVESWLPTVLTQTSGNFVSGLEEKTKSFYNDLHPFVKQNSTAFSTKTTRAGDEWNTHFAEISVAANAGGDVKKFALSGDNLIENGYYAANELIKTTGTDEDGKSGMKFTDRNGQTVLTRRINDDGNYDTYYVYNDFGQLVWVIPPMAAEASVIDGDVLDKYGYFYKYDKYGNCIEKKLPGCAPIYMVYDKAQRLILSQDGNLHEANKWLVSKYDEYGRAVYTAILASENKREDFAEIIKNEIVTEEFTLSNSFNGIGYTCNYFPEISEILSVNYYDDYAFLGLYSGNVLQNLVFIPQSNFEQEAGTPLGLATGSRTYILDGSGAFLTSTVHYDRWGQAIQTRSQNHLGGYDAAHIKYDAFGKVTNTYKTHTSTSPQTPSGGFTERYTYEYDHAFRPTVTKYQLNGNAEIKLSHNFYDELGRLKTKNRHNSADIETFEYNIQNWLTKKTSGNFEENLDYQGSFTGTITSMSWKNTGSSAVNKYIFTYDKLNRLKSGVLDNGGFAENFEYDKNGNIEHLERYFKNTQIDDLKMDYNDNGNIGNQLKSVKDYANHNLTNLYDLKEYTGQTNEELIYDANGNLIKDLDRKILQIQYNYLNLPARTIFEDGSEIVNIYASNASKLSAYYITAFTRQIDPREKTAEVLNNIKNATGTHYCGNIEYIFDKNGTTETIKTTRIHNAEGYYEGEKWYYFRKDHLGNNREVFYVGELNLNSGELNFDGLLDGSHIRYETTTVQVTNYYPSGVPWSSGKYLSVPKYTQPYKYNGKEYIEMNDYDVYEYGFRGYYATIGRFTQIDPAAEGTYSKSPYAYASNGFVGEIDFMGLYGATGFTNKGNEYDTGYEEFVTIGTGGSDIGGLKSRFGNNFGIFDPALLVYNLTYINDDGEFISHINSSDKRIIVIHKDGTQDHVGYEMNAVDYSKYKEGDRVKGWYFNQITISITATAGFQFSFIPQLGVNAISWDILNFSWTFGKNGFSYDGDTWFGGENAIISQGISVGYYLQAGIVGQQFEAPGNNYQAKNQQLTGLSSLFHMLSTAGKWTDGDFNFNISLSAPIFASVTATISGNIYYQYWKH